MVDDLISRHAAIDVLKETDDVGVCWKGGYVQRHSDFEEAINCIKELPTAEITDEDVKAYCRPRHLVVITGEFFEYLKQGYSKLHRHGNWKHILDLNFMCSECGWIDKWTSYCPNCGARMDAE